MKLKLSRLNSPFHLQAVNEDGNTVDIDGSAEIGGQGKGMRPTQLLASSLAACSSIDVLMILEKQKIVPSHYEVDVEVVRKDEVPAVFESIHLIYKLKGDVPEDRLKRAVDLSVNKYCTVARMIESTTKITYSIELNKQT